MTTQSVQSVPAALAIAKNASAVLQMLDMFDEFATDPILENEGAWVEFKKGTFYKVCRANNDAYSEKLNKLMEEHRDVLIKGDDAAKELSERLMNELMAETVLKGWKTVQTVDGEEISVDYIRYKGVDQVYSREVAVQLLGHRDFREWVKRQSEYRDYYKAVLVEEASKN